ncbi:uncharacterized protein LOC127866471 isoform X2 [Dreissena polymorpha]|nr:uncharacterized protein LOC127866471 isoform X2 [Dreissena polymorpha]
MHRATERRWATLFLILLAAAAILQMLGFFLPNWLRVYDPRLKVAQDYALWYVTQCYEERWSCSTRTYYQLYNWLNANHTFDGVPLLLDMETVRDTEGLYTVGLFGAIVVLWPCWKRRQQTVSKKFKGQPSNVGLILAAFGSFLSGLLVVIATGMFGSAASRHRNVHGSLVAIGFGAAGGAVSLIMGAVIALRVFLKHFCPDCVPLSRDIHLHEACNQVDVMVATDNDEQFNRYSNPRL